MWSLPIRFNDADLIPSHWGDARTDQTMRAYNPAITRFRKRLLMAYRVDSGVGSRIQRRIGLCELDESLCVIPGTVTPVSDSILGGHPLHYDPRFLIFQDRLFIHYNNNFNTLPNHIYLVELDPHTYRAVSGARELRLVGPRQPVEKNWMLFEHAAELFAVYQPSPHRVLRVVLGDGGDVPCEPIYEVAWDVSSYTGRFGELRGGTPPVRSGNVYVSFFHSVRPVSSLYGLLQHWPVSADTTLPQYLARVNRRLRRHLGRVRYSAGAYTFAAAPPFRPLWMTAAPVLQPERELPYQLRRRVNPQADGIVYPCGAIPWHEGRWLVSYGVHDEHCQLRQISLPLPVVT